MYNTRFYKGNLEAEDFLKDKIYKVIFDKFNEKKNDVQIFIRRL